MGKRQEQHAERARILRAMHPHWSLAQIGRKIAKEEGRTDDNGEVKPYTKGAVSKWLNDVDVSDEFKVATESRKQEVQEAAQIRLNKQMEDILREYEHTYKIVQKPKTNPDGTVVMEEDDEGNMQPDMEDMVVIPRAGKEANMLRRELREVEDANLTLNDAKEPIKIEEERTIKVEELDKDVDSLV